MKKGLMGSALPILASFALQPAFAAQEAPRVLSGAGQADGSETVEDIIVTATRREASLQEVPATIQAVSSESLKAMKIDGILKLPTLVPGLVIVPTGGNNLFLRGVGSGSTGYNEAQTAVYIDGVFLANPAMGIFSFNSVERIEVLKGPQGTLYGRNATAGLVSVITRDPSPDFALEAEAGYGNFDTVNANLYASVPLASNLAANVSAFYQNQHDGWSQNVFMGNDVQKGKEFALLAKIQWQPSDATSVTASFIYDFNNRNFGYAVQTYPGTLSLDGTPYLGKYRVSSRIEPSAPFRAYIGSLKIVQDIGPATLTSTTAYQRSSQNASFAGGFTPSAGTLAVPTSYQAFNQANRTWSQEFQLASNERDARLSWVIGTFYYNDITTLDLYGVPTCVGNICASAGGRPPNRVFGRPTTEAISGYGDFTYSIFEGTRITLGLRYNDETKKLSGFSENTPGYSNSVPGPRVPFVSSAAVPGRKNWSKLTYRVVLAQDLSENVNVYVSHNFGFKAGAYNANAFTNPPVDPELLYATEVGFKSELFGRRLRLNASYFHYNYQDVQLRSQAPPALPGQPLLLNVAEENIDGVDVDFSAVLAPGLRLNGAFEILDAKYADYPGTTCVTGPRLSPTGTVLPGASIFACNLAGKRLPFAPPFSASLGISYELETSTGSYTFTANDQYQSAHPLSGDGFIRQKSFHLVDASILWRSSDGHFNAQLWGRNLTNRFVWAAAARTNEFGAIPSAPRTYGASLGYSF